jgi:hypothetical protein
MYAKVHNNTVIKSPYTFDDLRKENPQTSFPDRASDSLFAEYGVVPVTVKPQPEVDHTKNVRFGGPVFNESTQSWEVSWIVEDAAEDEIIDRVLKKQAEVREERDSLIAKTDWMVIKHLELNENIPGVWEVYRQALRDVPQQDGFPWNVTWPVKPA